MNEKATDLLIYLPKRREFLKGIKAFERHEKREAMYRVATYLMDQFWNRPSAMSDGLGVLLLTWNQAFYRFGSFNFNKLEDCIKKNIKILNAFRDRDIGTLSAVDEKTITSLFTQFNTTLSIADGKAKGRKSPVATAKALNLLAPKFFPL